ncbi:hypothetical protein P0082_04030 [Candidatus Haliotispira prima]|uniref:HEAT repeat domain-containing protein n=1 Tax=Candidatus Haliotispira prima TaxID=3034016 RepID=A0ABY8MJ50_9SPIO|nr:hypothetical protein P0082_04030 [Candidatus Haliotispira prima]
MKTHGGPRLALANSLPTLRVICFLLPGVLVALHTFGTSGTLAARESGSSMLQIRTTRPVAKNAWEEIYFRIAGTFSPASLLELLKSMELESDQAGLASSYVLILKDQIYSYADRHVRDPIHTEQILSLLLDKVAEETETVTQENPEIANVIALALIPDLDYNIVMGKANYALGRLGAEDFSEDIARRLEDVNNIMTTNGDGDSYGLNYSAAGCLDALAELEAPGSFAVLFQVKYGPFSKIVRDKASRLMKMLRKDHPEAVEQGFASFIMRTPNLVHLSTIIHSIGDEELGFSSEVGNKVNLALLTRMNESRWSIPPLDSKNIEAEILRKTINNFLDKGAEGLEEETSEQLKQSYLDSDNINVKLLVLQAIGKLRTENGIRFLQDEIVRLNAVQRSDSINYADVRILRQLMYSLLVSKNSGTETVTVLRDVSVTSYPAIIRQIALDILADIS